MGRLTTPKSVSINSINYSVDESDVVVIDNSTNYSGSIDYPSCKINILSSMAEQRKMQTFYHELVHGMLYEAGFYDHDEDVVDRLSRVMMNVIANNNFYEEGEEVGQSNS